MELPIHSSTDIQVSDNNFLYIRVVSNVPDIVFTVTIKLINTNNEERIISENFKGANIRVVKTETIRLTKGVIKQISIIEKTKYTMPAETTCSISLYHGSNTTNGIFLQSVIQGWFTFSYPLNYPTSPIKIPYPGNGYVRVEDYSPNLAGGNASISLNDFNPGEFWGVYIWLDTSAVVASRYLFLRYIQTDGTEAISFPNIVQTASTSFIYAFTAGTSSVQNRYTSVTAPLPTKYHNKYSQIKVTVNNSDVNDAIPSVRVIMFTGQQFPL